MKASKHFDVTEEVEFMPVSNGDVMKKITKRYQPRANFGTFRRFSVRYHDETGHFVTMTQSGTYVHVDYVDWLERELEKSQARERILQGVSPRP